MAKKRKQKKEGAPKKKRKPGAGAPKGSKNALGNSGRPDNFKSSYTEKLIKFFDTAPYRAVVMEKSEEFFATGKSKKKSQKLKHMPNKMPTLYRFARSIGVDYTTVWRWAEKGETMQGEDRTWLKETAPDFIKFCNAYKEAKELQKEFLISLGLGGISPSSSFIFTAKNVTDMRDKQETEVTHRGSIIYLPPKK